jgi:hypothetical protein
MLTRRARVGLKYKRPNIGEEEKPYRSLDLRARYVG